jgi:hypothetical protein
MAQARSGYLGAALGVAVLGTAVLGVTVLGTAVLQPGIAPVSPALAVTLGCAPFSQSEHHTPCSCAPVFRMEHHTPCSGKPRFTMAQARSGYLGAALGVAVLGTAVLGVAVLGVGVLQPGITPVSPALAVTMGCAPFSQSEHHKTVQWQA